MPLLNHHRHGQDFVFLVRDDQLEEANQIATRNGLINVGHDAFPPAFALERARIGHIYGTRDNRFILAPISYTGIDMDELVIRDRSKLPWIVHTVPFPAFCTACVRIISREEPGTMIAHALEADLNSAIKSRYDMGEPKICWGEKPQTVDYGGVAHMISAKGTFRTVRSLEFHWQVASWPFKEGESWMVQAIISWYYEGKELPTARDDLD